MNWAELVRGALESIVERRSRSALTVLGLLIGIAAVILTVGLGEGAQAQVGSAISALGTNMLIITPGSTSAAGVSGGLGSASTLTLADATALASATDCPDISQVAPVTQHSASLTAAANNWTAPVVGTTSAYLVVRDRQVVVGRSLTAADVQNQSHVALIGTEVAQNLFPSGRVVGRTMELEGVPFTVVGELNPAGASANANEDNLVLIPISVADTIFGQAGPYAHSLSQILVSATSAGTMSAAYQEADSLLLELHQLPSQSVADFTITPQTSLLSTASSVSKTMTVLLAGVAAIALLVGGIGVMNIMLVSVSERVQEIGLRKALGATPGLILRQFLIEATLLGLAGGVLGVSVGLAGALVLPPLLHAPIAVSIPAIIGAVVAAVGIGLSFGVYPAARAARLSPIEALRSA
ncbi:MAG: ABC transporter permease [Candidatus Dormibacteria bacterium]